MVYTLDKFCDLSELLREGYPSLVRALYWMELSQNSPYSSIGIVYILQVRVAATFILFCTHLDFVIYYFWEGDEKRDTKSDVMLIYVGFRVAKLQLLNYSEQPFHPYLMDLVNRLSCTSASV